MGPQGVCCQEAVRPQQGVLRQWPCLICQSMRCSQEWPLAFFSSTHGLRCHLCNNKARVYKRTFLGSYETLLKLCFQVVL